MNMGFLFETNYSQDDCRDSSISLSRPKKMIVYYKGENCKKI